MCDCVEIATVFTICILIRILKVNLILNDTQGIVNDEADLSRNCWFIKTANPCNICDKGRIEKICMAANLKIPVGIVSISTPA